MSGLPVVPDDAAEHREGGFHHATRPRRHRLRHTGLPMTPLQYWSRWAGAGLLALALARWLLVQPILDAIAAAR